MKDNKQLRSSMIEPSLNSLLEKVDSRFTLVVEVAKRARQLVDGFNKLTKCSSEKPVTVATHEVNEDRITFIRTKSGIK